MLTPDDILKLPDAARRNLRLRTSYGRRRKAYTKRLKSRTNCFKIARRKVFPSDIEVSHFFRENDIHTWKQFDKASMENEMRIRRIDVMRHFGSMKEACMKIWGPPDWAKMLSPSYFIKCVSEFGLWSKRKYEIARSSNPDIIPPMKEVLLCWGSFSNMVECAKRRDVKKSIDEYVRYVLSHKKKIPSSDELNRVGLRIGPAVEIFGCKQKFDDFVLNYIAGHIIEVSDEN